MSRDQRDLRLSWMANQVTKGHMSRREFIGRAALLGVGTALATSMASQAVSAAGPKKGGKMIVGVAHGSTTDSLDPATYENGFTADMCYALHGHLTELDNYGKLIPQLAESWEASADASQWTFKLRKGVEFHNGKSMTAKDVVASINHHRGDDSKSAAKPIVDPIEEIKADDDHTVVFSLKTGNADFPFIVTDYHLTILPETDEGKVDALSGVGSGGYMLTQFEPGVRATGKRAPNYWRDSRAHVDEFELLSIIDVTARTNALTTGEIHAMDRCDIKTLHLLKRNKAVKILETTGYAHYTIPMRTDMKPFDDNNIRLALKHGVDREALLQTVLRGHGKVGNDHPISTTNRYHASDLPQKAYDPDKSKFYLKKAGLDSLTVSLSAADAAFPGAVDAAVLYKEHAEKANITIDIVREPNDGYWSNVWMKKAWCMCYWGGRPTEDQMFSTAYAQGASWNDTFWEHEAFNKMLVQARAELDNAKRREIYVDMQRILSDEGGVVVPMFNNYVFAASDKIGHDESMSGTGELDGNRLIERWWFA